MIERKTSQRTDGENGGWHCTLSDKVDDQRRRGVNRLKRILYIFKEG